MTEQAVPTKAELLELLRTSGRELRGKIEALPAAGLEEGRYEGGWNGRQILAHVAAIEWMLPRIVDRARQQAAAPTAESSGQTEQWDVNAYNDKQVSRRASLSIAELVDEFERNRAASIAAVESTDEALLTAPVRLANGRVSPLAGELRRLAIDHAGGHLRDITGTG
ncbi:MAG: DinB family protein [Chloroflexi bacterium]|nr:DinB family protein [Chloroflexota bacterium]